MKEIKAVPARHKVKKAVLKASSEPHKKNRTRSILPKVTIVGILRKTSTTDFPDLGDTYRDAATFVVTKFAALGSQQSLFKIRIDQYIAIEGRYMLNKAVFPYQQVEQNLAQAASLLERGITERAEWQLLRERSFNMLSNLYETVQQLDLHSQQNNAGYYDMDRLEAVSFAAAEAQTAGLSAYMRQWLVGNDDYHSPASEPPEFAIRESAQIAERSADISSNSASQRYAYYSAKGTYEASNVAFRRNITIASRASDAQRVISYATSGAANYFEDRISAASKRFTDDFSNAMDRISALQVGLSKIYNYNIPLPEKSDTPFDDILDWIRDASEFMASLLAREQSYILTLSLQAVANWTAGKGSDHGGRWEFTLDDSFFPDQCHVRIRGVSVFAESNDPNSLYSAAVRIPKSATVRYLLETSEPSLDQNDLPTLRIGRVQNRSAVREPDIVGTISVYNASPLGTWRIVLTDKQKPPNIGDGPTTPGLKNGNRLRPETSPLTNVFIDVHVAVRNVLSQSDKKLVVRRGERIRKQSRKP